MSGFTSNRGGCKLYAVDAALCAHLRPRNGAAGGAVSALSVPVLHSQNQIRLAGPARRGQPPRKEQLCRRPEALLLRCLEVPNDPGNGSVGNTHNDGKKTVDGGFSKSFKAICLICGLGRPRATLCVMRTQESKLGRYEQVTSNWAAKLA